MSEFELVVDVGKSNIAIAFPPFLPDLHNQNVLVYVKVYGPQRTYVTPNLRMLGFGSWTF